MPRPLEFPPAQKVRIVPGPLFDAFDPIHIPETALQDCSNLNPDRKTFELDKRYRFWQAWTNSRSGGTRGFGAQSVIPANPVSAYASVEVTL